MIRFEKIKITRNSIQPIHRKYGQNIFSPYEWGGQNIFLHMNGHHTYVGHNIDAWP